MRFCSYCQKFLPENFVDEITGAGGYGIFSPPGKSSKLVACRHCLYGDEYPGAPKTPERALDAPLAKIEADLAPSTSDRWLGAALMVLGVLMFLLGVYGIMRLLGIVQP